MNYLQAVAYVESLAPTILNPDLHRFSLFMQEHEAIQNTVPAFHIAGTNGKGSTAAIVDGVLRAGGMKVGRFTGPHLLRWNERFHLNGKAIPDEVFAQYVSRLRELSEQFGQRHPELGRLTWFEFLTAIAFFYFKDNGAEVVVFEVGLGGRWDATNVLAHPLVSTITTIGLDHTHILGETIPEIAGEKAGIIKPGVPVVTGAEGDALDVIAERARQNRAPLVVCRTPDVVSGDPAPSLDQLELRRALSKLALRGPYQQLNALVAAVSIAVAQSQLGRDLVPQLAAGFARVYWPGRFQYLAAKHVLLDGAHNVPGAQALREAIDTEFGAQRRILVLSFFQNKNVEGAIEQLVRPGDIVFASEAQTNRAVCPAHTIVDYCTKRGACATACMTIADAFNSARKARSDDRELIVVTGSFATIKETMLALGWQSVEDGLVLSD